MLLRVQRNLQACSADPIILATTKYFGEHSCLTITILIQSSAPYYIFFTSNLILYSRSSCFEIHIDGTGHIFGTTVVVAVQNYVPCDCLQSILNDIFPVYGHICSVKSANLANLQTVCLIFNTRLATRFANGTTNLRIVL